MSNEKIRKSTNSRIKAINKGMILEIWPDFDSKMVYTTDDPGFVPIPRTMPLIAQLMDGLSPGKPVFGTFFALWCRPFDDGYLVSPGREQLAFESGFTTQRGVSIWTERMKILADLGFIKSKEGTTGNFHYLLVLNPIKVIEAMLANGKIKQSKFSLAYRERLLSVRGKGGAEKT